MKTTLEQTNEILHMMGDSINKFFNDNNLEPAVNFILIAADRDGVRGERTNYISNMDKGDTIEMLDELATLLRRIS